MGQNTICWTDIPVFNLDRAAAFYSAVLGQPLTIREFDNWGYAVLPQSGEGASGCLAMADEDNQPSRSGPLIYLSVDGRLDEAVYCSEKHGGRVLRAKHAIAPYGYRAIVVDSEGNRIALHSDTA